jgi:hypothetical protein
MSIHNIDVVKIQALQRRAETFNDVFSRQTVVVDENFAICTAWK